MIYSTGSESVTEVIDSNYQDRRSHQTNASNKMTRKMKGILISVIGLAVTFFLVNYTLTNVQPSCTLANLASAVDDTTTLTAVNAKWFPVQHSLVDGYVTTTNPGPPTVS